MSLWETLRSGPLARRERNFTVEMRSGEAQQASAPRGSARGADYPPAPRPAQRLLRRHQRRQRQVVANPAARERGREREVRRDRRRAVSELVTLRTDVLRAD